MEKTKLSLLAKESCERVEAKKNEKANSRGKKISGDQGKPGDIERRREGWVNSCRPVAKKRKKKGGGKSTSGQN